MRASQATGHLPSQHFKLTADAPTIMLCAGNDELSEALLHFTQLCVQA
jgi:hypothetical protein